VAEAREPGAGEVVRGGGKDPGLQRGQLVPAQPQLTQKREVQRRRRRLQLVLPKDIKDAPASGPRVNLIPGHD
jgi:hypothetical protein